MLEAKLVAIAGNGRGVDRDAARAFGTLQVSGRGGFGGSPIAGTLLMGEEKLGFEGALQ